MILPQQAAIFLEAIEGELMLSPDTIVRWADSAIIASEKPDSWLIELSTLSPADMTGYVKILRAQASSAMPLPTRWRVQIVLAAYEAGRLNLRDCLPKIFYSILLVPNKPGRDSLDEQLRDALVEWDCQESSDLIPEVLQARFRELFREYLMDAGEISQLLDWKSSHG